MTSGYVTVLLIFIARMPFLMPTLDNADPFFALVIIPGFYLNLIEVAVQDLVAV